MKKIFVSTCIITILSLAGTALFAQGKNTGERAPGMYKPFHNLNMLQERLNLTDAQVDKIYMLQKDYMNQCYQNRDDSAKINELREKYFSDVRSVLTDEQKTKWEDFKNNNAKARGGRDHYKKHRASKYNDGDYGFHGGFFREKLGLTDEQSDKIHKICKNNMDNFYKNRKDEDKIRELSEKQKAEIEKVLTSEQIAKLQKYREKRFENNRNEKNNNSKKGKK